MSSSAPMTNEPRDETTAARLTLGDIRRTTFRTAKQVGYDIVDVDAFFDRLERHIADPTSDPATILNAVRQARFHMSAERGYEPQDVDNFLDLLEESLAAATRTAAS